MKFEEQFPSLNKELGTPTFEYFTSGMSKVLSKTVIDKIKVKEAIDELFVTRKHCAITEQDINSIWKKELKMILGLDK